MNKEKGYLGLKKQVCHICGSSGEFKTYLVSEMMQGSREEFRYFACSFCDCLQIETVPENLFQYYGENYYSYAVPDVVNHQNETKEHNDWILDVGCGAGDWLCDMVQMGYKNLYGCDPFIVHDLQYPNGVKIKKCSIHEMEGKFDLIRLADSFEHMEDPLEVFTAIRNLLTSGGCCWLNIPIYPNIAFDLFGTYWYQLDAPRHLFLHSKKSIVYLAKKSGLVVKKIKFDSNNSQFIRSRLYEVGISFWNQTPQKCGEFFSESEAEQLQLEAERANENEVGDHAVFYLAIDDQHVNVKNDDQEKAAELSDTITEALEYLIKQAEERKLQENSFMLYDILEAHRLLKERFLSKQ